MEIHRRDRDRVGVGYPHGFDEGKVVKMTGVVGAYDKRAIWQFGSAHDGESEKSAYAAAIPDNGAEQDDDNVMQNAHQVMTAFQPVAIFGDRVDLHRFEMFMDSIGCITCCFYHDVCEITVEL
ncbi:hypothetical protein [Hoeflea sp.]|uniref:hypothetical protein n=1 Tax=Hoeflea sp. TaxID=1940281 RepID=UPI0025C11FBE|nr:hypothetical protein [Hoeflea sp.]